MQLDPALIQRVQTLIKQAKKEGLSIRDVLAQTLAEQRTEQDEHDDPIDIELNRSFTSLIQKLKHIDHIPTVPVPKRFTVRYAHINNAVSIGSSFCVSSALAAV